MTKTIKLTNRDFKLFKKECEKWIDRLELGDWDVRFEFGCIDSAGTCRANYSQMNATIAFNSEFSDYNTISKINYIKTIAMHECLELLLMPINMLAGARTYDVEEIEHQFHRIINRLIKIL